MPKVEENRMVTGGYPAQARSGCLLCDSGVSVPASWLPDGSADNSSDNGAVKVLFTCLPIRVFDVVASQLFPARE